MQTSGMKIKQNTALIVLLIFVAACAAYLTAVEYVLANLFDLVLR